MDNKFLLGFISVGHSEFESQTLAVTRPSPPFPLPPSMFKLHPFNNSGHRDSQDKFSNAPKQISAFSEVHRCRTDQCNLCLLLSLMRTPLITERLSMRNIYVSVRGKISFFFLLFFFYLGDAPGLFHSERNT